ncbi:Hypothetical_protein [Hexamita inflata]|uniref:Hypothetical_protein n=1 Tax=Hexamita inflata TaxID=28002 RepID=A0AA86Q9E7_9EUKA|nr:Hypothetical protein HINF_LOCUS42619 [Hexamita inflata]
MDLTYDQYVIDMLQNAVMFKSRHNLHVKTIQNLLKDSVSIENNEVVIDKSSIVQTLVRIVDILYKSQQIREEQLNNMLDEKDAQLEKLNAQYITLHKEVSELSRMGQHNNQDIINIHQFEQYVQNQQLQKQIDKNESQTQLSKLESELETINQQLELQKQELVQLSQKQIENEQIQFSQEQLQKCIRDAEISKQLLDKVKMIKQQYHDNEQQRRILLDEEQQLITDVKKLVENQVQSQKLRNEKQLSE